MKSNKNSLRDFDSCFHLICLIVTISVVCYCFYQYTLDEDVSLIDFKIFHDNSEGLYPTTTLCFYNPFLEDKLKDLGNRINTTAYSKYLQGYLEDERMTNIDYDKVTLSLGENLLQVSGKMENGTFLWLYDKENRHPTYIDSRGKPKYYTSFRSGLNKCFSFDIPFIEGNLMWSLFIKMKSDSFPRDFRDNEIRFDGSNSTQGGFKVSFHYPFQRFHSSGATKYQWNSIPPMQRQELPCRGFYMRFRIKGIEVLARRNKRASECNTDWLSNDLFLQNNIIRHMKCYPPYMNHWMKNANFSRQLISKEYLGKEFSVIRKLPMCNNSDYIKHISDPTNDDLQRHPKPCRVIEKLGFDFDEGFELPLNKDGICQHKDNGWFVIKVYFGETDYKEIKQVREINLEALAGNISGYIGFILGYSLVQLPSLFQIFKSICKTY